MQLINQPIQMIAFCGSDGSIRPIRFRAEDAQHALHTYQVEEIVDRREVQYVGLEAMRFLCRACEEQETHLMELCYHIRGHSWTMLRILY